MALIITAQFWKDPGFTEGAVEVPKLADCGDVDKLPVYDIDAHYDLLPSKGRLFSELKAPLPFDVAQDLSYLYIEIEYDRPGDSVTRGYFGWIESVEMIRDDETSPQVLIHWHVDLWRTYAKDAVFGYGVVNNRPDADTPRPPQECPHVYMAVRTVENMLSPDNIQTYITVLGSRTELYASVAWLYVLYTDEDTQGRVTSHKVVCAPVVIPSVDGRTGYSNVTLKSGEKTALQYSQVVGAVFDELLGLVPSRVAGAFLSLVPPGNVTYFNDAAERTVNMVFSAFTIRGGSYIAYNATADGLASFHKSLINPVKTTDTSELVITDNKCQPVAVVPYGLTVQEYDVQIIVAGSSMYHRIRFNGKDSSIFGTEFMVPLEAVPVTSNSWSEYAYAGQREYDVEQRKLNNQMALAQGLMGSVTGAGQGAILGSIGEVGKYGMNTHAATLARASVFGAVGAGVEVIGAVGQYMMATSFNDRLQGLEDTRSAMQSDQLLIPASTIDWILTGRPISICTRTPDDYSVEIFEKQIETAGVEVQEIHESVTDDGVLESPGPYRITSLVVRGNIPVDAKQYIKGRLDNGVRLI